MAARRRLKRDLRIARRKQEMLGPHAQAVIYETANGLIAMPPTDMTIGKELAQNGHWDIEEIKQLKSQIRPEDHLYVIGTHVGTLLVPLSKVCQSVVGYEANPETFRYLQQNLLLNQVSNAQVFNLAAGNQEGKIEFLQNTHNSGGSKIMPVQESAMYRRDNPATIEVDTVPLQRHIAQNELPAPDVMIMDIEGAEYFALEGLGKDIQHLRLLYIEFVPHHLRHVSNVDLDGFLAMVLPHFTHVELVRHDLVFDLRNDDGAFLSTIQHFYEKGVSDDLLLKKK